MARKFLPALAANLSAALAELLLMAAAAWLIASAALRPPLSALALGITLVRAAGISRAALRYADRFLSHRIIFEVLDALREKLFKRAAARISYRAGEVLRELTVEADLLKDLLPRVVLPISTALLVTALLTVFLSWTLGIWALILPVIFVLVMVFSVLADFSEADDSAYRGRILDFHGVDELKIFGAAPAIGMLNAAAGKFGAARVAISTRRARFDTLMKILAAAGICAILALMSSAVGRIELAVWALVLMAMLEIFATIPPAVRNYKQIRSIRIDDEEIAVAQEFKTDCAVEFRGVNFGYDAAKIILRDFNLKIGRVEHWAVIGESGSGKTTLVYLMTKIFEADGGVVATNGTIGAATSTNYIFAESIRANFAALHGDISDAEIVEALKICQLGDFRIDAVLGEDGAEISGGERVRLQTALAIAKNPDILILDEPTAGLDKTRANNLVDAVIADSANKNRTLIVITHDLSIAGKFGNVVALK